MNIEPMHMIDFKLKSKLMQAQYIIFVTYYAVLIFLFMIEKLK